MRQVGVESFWVVKKDNLCDRVFSKQNATTT